MHSSVSEINVHHVGPAATQDRDQHLIFAPINQRRPALDKFHPAVTEQISVRPRNSFDVIKVKAFLKIAQIFLCLRQVHLVCDNKPWPLRQTGMIESNFTTERFEISDWTSPFASRHVQDKKQ